MKSLIRQKSSHAAVACAIGLSFLVAGCGKTAPVASNTMVVGTYTVTTQPIELTNEVPGRTNAWRIAEVRPQVSGVIQKRLFDEGTTVKLGQPLYQIDPRPFQATYDKAQASLVSTRLLAERDSKLLLENAVSKQQNDDAQAAYQQAAADVETARINLEYTRVLSPLTGFIGRSSVTEGALVQNGQASALATVQQIDPIYVDVTESSDALLRLRKELAEGHLASTGKDQAAVQLVMDDGSVYKRTGSLAFSEVSVDQGTSSVTLRAIFPNPDHELLPGMYVRARLDEGVDQNAILVPEQAVQRDTTGAAYVWRVDAQSKVQMQRIGVDRVVGNTWLVTSGLKPGDKVVAEGTQLMQQDMSVATQPADTVHIDLGNSGVEPATARANTASVASPSSAVQAASARG